MGEVLGFPCYANSKEFISAARTAKRRAIWIADQGDFDTAKGAPIELLDFVDIIKRLEGESVQELRCGTKPGSLLEAPPA